MIRKMRCTSQYRAALTLCLFALVSCEREPGKVVSPAPNIVLVFVDDIGYEIIDDPDNLYDTPHIDSLKSWGMNFTNAYATPLCTPSRVQVLTGKYNYKNYRGFGLLNPRESTFADILKGANYSTLAAGKWQLYGNRRQRALAKGRGSLPNEVGFDQSALWQVTEKNGSRFKNPWIVVNGNQDRQFNGRYGPDLFADYIEGFLERPRDNPFLIYYPMVLTHDPFQPTPGSDGYEDFDPDARLNDSMWFANNVTYMDKLIGRLSSNLTRTGLMQNTLLLFVGDNGTDVDVTSNFLKGAIRGQKAYSTTYGTHVPLIAVWPEEIEGNSLNTNLVDLTDVFPTFADAAGISLPDSLDLDGLSLLNQLKGKKEAEVRRSIYTYYAPEWGGFKHRSWAQTRDRKYYNDGSYYFLDLDIMEKNPVAVEDLNADELLTYKYLKSEVTSRPIPKALKDNE